MSQSNLRVVKDDETSESDAEKQIALQYVRLCNLVAPHIVDPADIQQFVYTLRSIVRAEQTPAQVKIAQVMAKAKSQVDHQIATLTKQTGATASQLAAQHKMQAELNKRLDAAEARKVPDIAEINKSIGAVRNQATGIQRELSTQISRNKSEIERLDRDKTDRRKPRVKK